MTENEARIIIEGYFGDDEIINEAIELAGRALEEIQQYRALGTVEELKSKIEELKRWHTDHIVKEIKNEFANTSTLICHNCDHKDEYIMELEVEVEELREAREKQRAKKPFIQKTDEKTLYKCPCCKKIFVEAYENSQRGYIPKYCEMCGQPIDF